MNLKLLPVLALVTIAIAVVVSMSLSYAVYGNTIHSNYKHEDKLTNTCNKAKHLINITEKLLNYDINYIKKHKIHDKLYNKLINKTDTLIEESKEYLVEGDCWKSLRTIIKALQMARRLHILIHRNLISKSLIIEAFSREIAHVLYMKIMRINKMVHINVTGTKYLIMNISKSCYYKCREFPTLRLGLECLVRCYRHELLKHRKLIMLLRYSTFIEYLNRILNIIDNRVKTLNVSITYPKYVNNRCILGNITIHVGSRIIFSKKLPCNTSQTRILICNVVQKVINKLRVLKHRLLMLNGTLPLLIRNRTVISNIRSKISTIVKMINHKCNILLNIASTC